MKMTRRAFLFSSLSTCMLITGGLVGCNNSSEDSGSAKTASTSEKESTKTVVAKIDDNVSVKLNVPKSWDAEKDDDGDYTNITPSSFNGLILLGISIDPMSEFSNDQEVLEYWNSNDPDTANNWEKVNDGVSPIYETALSHSGDSELVGVARVAICGDYAIACECYTKKGDWKKGAKKQLEKVISTFSVTNPVAPNYPPKDVFTIVSATKSNSLGYGFWELKVTVKNNTDTAKQFLGFQIDELDASGNIIDSYMSYNKNASYAVVEPGQQYTISLTEAEEDGIAGMQSRYCEWGDDSSDSTKSEYSQVFKTSF